jgi:uncharacterized alpha-E superfamily protein
MSPEERRRLIESQPARLVAQEPVSRSTAPAWTGRALRPTYVALRVYLVATGDSYLPMPGGLVRVSEDPDELDLSILAGGASKDGWVLSEGPVRVVSLLQPPGQAVPLKRSGADLPSRVADNMFWLGRHVERAEGLVRLLRPLLARLTGESAWGAEPGGNGRPASPRGPEQLPELHFLLRTLAHRGQIEPGFVVEGMRQQLPAIGQVLPAAVLDETQPNSLRSTVSAMVRIAGLVRDRLSADTWRTVMRLDRDLRPLGQHARVDLDDLLAVLNGMLIDLAAFAGLVQENTTRTQGWRFLDLGRRIERSQDAIGLIRSALVHLPEGDEGRGVGPTLEALLEVVDSLMTYRSRYLATLQVAPVLDLVLTDETNPRSLAFQLAVLAEHVEHLPREESQAGRSPEQRLALACLNSLRLADVARLSQAEDGERSRLDQLLGRLARRLPRLADLIAQKYLIHAGAPRQLSE